MNLLSALQAVHLSIYLSIYLYIYITVSYRTNFYQDRCHSLAGSFCPVLVEFNGRNEFTIQLLKCVHCVEL